jgi:hypothetical protein
MVMIRPEGGTVENLLELRRLAPTSPPLAVLLKLLTARQQVMETR